MTKISTQTLIMLFCLMTLSIPWPVVSAERALADDCTVTIDRGFAELVAIGPEIPAEELESYLGAVTSACPDASERSAIDSDYVENFAWSTAQKVLAIASDLPVAECTGAGTSSLKWRYSLNHDSLGSVYVLDPEVGGSWEVLEFGWTAGVATGQIGQTGSATSETGYIRILSKIFPADGSIASECNIQADVLIHAQGSTRATFNYYSNIASVLTLQSHGTLCPLC